MKVEKHHRRKEGKNNGNGCSKAFENVVRVFDDNCRNQATKDLDSHGSPRPTTKVAKDVADETVGCRELRSVQDRCNSREEGKQSQLDIPHP